MYDVGERRTIMLTFTFTLNETLDYDWFVLPTTTLAFVFFCNCIFNLCVYFDKLYCTLVKLLNTWSLFRSTFMGSPWIVRDWVGWWKCLWGQFIRGLCIESGLSEVVFLVITFWELYFNNDVWLSRGSLSSHVG